MKATGIVRKVDDLGRISVPKEVRQRLGIDSGEKIEIFFDGWCVVLKKHSSHNDIIAAVERAMEITHENRQSLKNEARIMALLNELRSVLVDEGA